MWSPIGEGGAPPTFIMKAHLDPKAWVEAWDAFVSVTPVAAWASLILVLLLMFAIFVWGVLSPLAEHVIVPIIRARRGLPKEDEDEEE